MTTAILGTATGLALLATFIAGTADLRRKVN